jgi:hypothetical protein
MAGTPGEDAGSEFRVEVPWRRAANETRENGRDHGRAEWWGEDAELKFHG